MFVEFAPAPESARLPSATAAETDAATESAAMCGVEDAASVKAPAEVIFAPSEYARTVLPMSLFASAAPMLIAPAPAAPAAMETLAATVFAFVVAVSVAVSEMPPLVIVVRLPPCA